MRLGAETALRQEGDVYRPQRRANPPSVRRAMCLFISEEVENIFGFVSYIELLQQRQVFTPEAPLRVVLLLVAYVPNYRVQLRMRVGKRAETFLPVESASDPSFALNEFGRVGLNISYQIRERNTGLQADQHMSVIRHGVYLDQLLPLFPNDAGDLFLKFFFEVRSYQTLLHGNGKDRLNVNLRECMGHLLPPSLSVTQAPRV